MIENGWFFCTICPFLYIYFQGKSRLRTFDPSNKWHGFGVWFLLNMLNTSFLLPRAPHVALLACFLEAIPALEWVMGRQLRVPGDPIFNRPFQMPAGELPLPALLHLEVIRRQMEVNATEAEARIARILASRHEWLPLPATEPERHAAFLVDRDFLMQQLHLFNQKYSCRYIVISANDEIPLDVIRASIKAHNEKNGTHFILTS